MAGQKHFAMLHCTYIYLSNMTTSTGNRTHKPSTKKIREHNTRHSCVKLEQTRIFLRQGKQPIIKMGILGTLLAN